MATSKQRLEYEVRLKDLATKDLKRFGTNVKKETNKAAASFKKLNTAAKGFGLAMKIAGAAAVFQGLRSGITRALEFSKAMGEVRTIMDESVISFDVANEKVKALALTLGAPAPEVAAGLYQTLSAGVTDAAEAFILLEQAGQLAVAGVASTSEAVDLLTTVTNAYGEVVTAQGIEKTSDMIQKTIQLGKTTMPELAASMGQVLPTASALGVSFEEVAASVATLTLSGLSTSEAVTQVNAVMTAFLKKGEQMPGIMGAAAIKQKGLTKAMQDLAVAMDGDVDKLTKLMGRVEGSKAIMALTGTQAEVFAEQLKAIGTASGETKEAFESMMNTTAKKMEVLKEGWVQGWEAMAMEIMGVADHMDSADIQGKAEGIKSTLEGLGTGIGPIAQAFATGLGVMTTAASALYYAVAKIGADDEQIDKMNDKILEQRIAWMKQADAARASLGLTSEFGDAIEAARQQMSSYNEAVTANSERAGTLIALQREMIEVQKAASKASGMGATDLRREKALYEEMVPLLEEYNRVRKALDKSATDIKMTELEVYLDRKKKAEEDALLSEEQLAASKIKSQSLMYADEINALMERNGVIIDEMEALTEQIGVLDQEQLDNKRALLKEEFDANQELRLQTSALMKEAWELEGAAWARSAAEAREAALLLKGVGEQWKAITENELQDYKASLEDLARSNKLFGMMSEESFEKEKQMLLASGDAKKAAVELSNLEELLAYQKLQEEEEGINNATRKRRVDNFKAFLDERLAEWSVAVNTETGLELSEIIKRRDEALHAKGEEISERERLERASAERMLALFKALIKGKIMAFLAGQAAMARVQGMGAEEAAGEAGGALRDIAGLVVESSADKLEGLKKTIADAKEQVSTVDWFTPEQQTQMGALIANVEQVALKEYEAAAAADALTASFKAQGPIIGGMKKGLQDFTSRIPEMGEAMAEVTAGALQAFTSGLTNAMMAWADGSKTAKEAFKDFSRQFITQVAAMIIQMLILQAIKAAVAFESGGVVEGGLGSLTALASGGMVPGGLGRAVPVKGYAAGGPIVSQPHIALIGEGKQNEAVVPLPDGRSIPVDMRGSSPSISFTINAVNARGIDELLVERQDTIRNLIRQAIAEDRVFRGSIAGV